MEKKGGKNQKTGCLRKKCTNKRNKRREERVNNNMNYYYEKNLHDIDDFFCYRTFFSTRKLENI